MNTAQFRALALQQVGKRYVFGAELNLARPSTWFAMDCSELVQGLFYQAGAPIVDGSANQYAACAELIGSLKVGDLFFLKRYGRVYHVGVYIGNNECVEARSSRLGVVKSSLASVNSRGAVWRRYGKLRLTSATSAPKPLLVVTASSLNVRSGPGIVYRRIHTLANGEKVTLLTSSGLWRKIAHGSVTGWAHSKYLKAV